MKIIINYGDPITALIVFFSKIHLMITVQNTSLKKVYFFKIVFGVEAVVNGSGNFGIVFFARKESDKENQYSYVVKLMFGD
jgi:hypothetical protein